MTFRSYVDRMSCSVLLVSPLSNKNIKEGAPRAGSLSESYVRGGSRWKAEVRRSPLFHDRAHHVLVLAVMKHKEKGSSASVAVSANRNGFGDRQSLLRC